MATKEKAEKESYLSDGQVEDSEEEDYGQNAPMSPKRDYPKKNASYYDAVQKSIYTFSDLIKPLYKEEFGMIPLETCYVVMFGEFWPEPFCSQDCINVSVPFEAVYNVFIQQIESLRHSPYRQILIFPDPDWFSSSKLPPFFQKQKTESFINMINELKLLAMDHECPLVLYLAGFSVNILVSPPPFELSHYNTRGKKHTVPHFILAEPFFHPNMDWPTKDGTALPRNDLQKLLIELMRAHVVKRESRAPQKKEIDAVIRKRKRKSVSIHVNERAKQLFNEISFKQSSKVLMLLIGNEWPQNLDLSVDVGRINITPDELHQFSVDLVSFLKRSSFNSLMLMPSHEWFMGGEKEAKSRVVSTVLNIKNHLIGRHSKDRVKSRFVEFFVGGFPDSNQRLQWFNEKGEQHLGEYFMPPQKFCSREMNEVVQNEHSHLIQDMFQQRIFIQMCDYVINKVPLQNKHKRKREQLWESFKEQREQQQNDRIREENKAMEQKKLESLRRAEERKAREKAENEKMTKEKAEREKKVREELENERKAREKAEMERKVKEKLENEKKAQDKEKLEAARRLKGIEEARRLNLELEEHRRQKEKMEQDRKMRDAREKERVKIEEERKNKEKIQKLVTEKGRKFKSEVVERLNTDIKDPRQAQKNKIKREDKEGVVEAKKQKMDASLPPSSKLQSQPNSESQMPSLSASLPSPSTNQLSSVPSFTPSMPPPPYFYPNFFNQMFPSMIPSFPYSVPSMASFKNIPPPDISQPPPSLPPSSLSQPLISNDKSEPTAGTSVPLLMSNFNFSNGLFGDLGNSNTSMEKPNTKEKDLKKNKDQNDDTKNKDDNSNGMATSLSFFASLSNPRSSPTHASEPTYQSKWAPLYTPTSSNLFSLTASLYNSPVEQPPLQNVQSDCESRTTDPKDNNNEIPKQILTRPPPTSLTASFQERETSASQPNDSFDEGELVIDESYGQQHVDDNFAKVMADVNIALSSRSLRF